MKTLFANTVFEFPTRRKWISPALKLFHRLNHSKELCVKLQTKDHLLPQMTALTLKEKCKLIIRRRLHLILTNE